MTGRLLRIGDRVRVEGDVTVVNAHTPVPWATIRVTPRNRLFRVDMDVCTLIPPRHTPTPTPTPTRAQWSELARIMFGRPFTSTDAMGLAAAGSFGIAAGFGFVCWQAIRCARKATP